jgi:RNA-directed DNA polymerase
MSRIGLTLNEQKTSIRDPRSEEFHFLGYTFGTRYLERNGRPYMATRPSKKSIQPTPACIRWIHSVERLRRW